MSTTTDAITLPCPLGCNERIAAQGSTVHYCVIRTPGAPTEREYVGTYDGAALVFKRNHSDAEIALRMYSEEIEGVYARPAEVVEVLYSDARDEYEATLTNEPNPELDTEYLAFLQDLPAAPAANPIEARTPDSFSGPSDSTATGREDAAPDLNCGCLDPSICWCGAYPMSDEAKTIYRDLNTRYAAESIAIETLTPTVNPGPATVPVAPDSPDTLVALLKAALEEWIGLGEHGITTPYDALLVQLARLLAPPVRRSLDHICGEALAYEYCKAPGAFLEKFDTFGAARQSAVTHAVAAWLGVTVGEVDQLWMESRLRQQNAAPAS